MPKAPYLQGISDHLGPTCHSRAKGMSRSQPSGARNQAAALQAEGVTVSTGSLGELCVDFAEFGWFPKALPSEADYEDSEDEDDEEK
jgi:hypothetical protein